MAALRHSSLDDNQLADSLAAICFADAGEHVEQEHQFRVSVRSGRM
jgi:hypothetical protein